MMREYKRYDEYKDSGVEWIGEIPEGWETVKLKFLLSNIDSGQREKGGGKIDYGVFSLGGEHIGWDGNLYLDSPKYVSEKFYRQMNSGKIAKKDILLVKDGATIGKTAYIDKIPKGKSVINEHVYRLSSNNKIISKLLYFMISGPVGLKQILLNVRGAAQGGLNLTFTDNLLFSLPPKSEQQKIASFLDQKTAKIDEIINKKEKLIDYLEKYKKSVITEAVTKGKLGDKYINEDGELVDEIEMKDSEVEWIGEIPEFIDAVKIKRLTQIKRGASPRPIDNPIYFDDKGEYSWVRISDVTKSDDYLLDTEQTLSKLGASKSVKMNKGDIFLSIAATVGKPIITKIKCCIHDGFVYFPEYKESKKFLFYIFKSEQPYRGLGKHGTQINLNTTIVGDIKIPYFKKSNQEKIAKYLDKKTRQISNLIQKTKASIQKYKEYKKSLIFEAVTGKIDLRDYELKGGEELAEHRDTKTADRKRVSKVN